MDKDTEFYQAFIGGLVKLSRGCADADYVKKGKVRGRRAGWARPEA